MYHIVYLTTNLVNQKIYIGIHSTYNLNDGYLGSGIAIEQAYAKYGKENFNRQILYYCLSREDSLSIEKQIVDLDFTHRRNTYNIDVGGTGCMHSRKHSEHSKQKIRDSIKGRTSSDETKNKIRNANIGKIVSDETKRKLSNRCKTREQLICPHCNKISTPPNYKRWHGDSCKFKA